ncbi:MAG: hypothetical protein NTY38_15435, partial [Acidobacteria bacterium]|nr:hypothetical protein [Acidobacteriota bacterium]
DCQSAGPPTTSPQVTGPQVTGPQVLGPQVIGPQVIGTSATLVPRSAPEATSPNERLRSP